MPIKYKIDVLSALKAAGYNTTRLRNEHLLREETIQNIREGKIVNAANLAKLCEMLDCQPGDLLECKKEDEK